MTAEDDTPKILPCVCGKVPQLNGSSESRFVYVFCPDCRSGPIRDTAREAIAAWGALTWADDKAGRALRVASKSMDEASTQISKLRAALREVLSGGEKYLPKYYFRYMVEEAAALGVDMKISLCPDCCADLHANDYAVHAPDCRQIANKTKEPKDSEE